MFQVLAIFAFVVIIVSIIVIISMWKLYTKAGQPGWAVIVPVYGTIVLLRIIRKPLWWLAPMYLSVINLFLPIPILTIIATVVSMVFGIWSINLFIKKFGKSSGYTVGCIFFPFVFFPVLAFGTDTVYEDGLNEEIENW